MADNVLLNRGAGGDTIAADDIGGVKHQLVKVEYGADDSATLVDSINRLPVTADHYGPMPLLFSRFLDTNGNGTGTKNAVGDYSGGVTRFRLKPGAGEIYRVARLLVTLEDAGSLDSGAYGNNLTLINGIEVRIEVDGGATITDLTDGVPVMTNAHWGRFSYDVKVSSFGIGNEHLEVRWTFANTQTEIRLEGDSSEQLVVLLNDDFTDLIDHYFMVQGYIETTIT